MSRLLFVVPPLTGHINPLVGVAAALADRGHQVAWAGPQPLVGEHLAGAEVHPAGDAERFALSGRPAGLRGYAALKYLWESYLVPLADAMVPGVRAAVHRFAPDVLVADQQAFAGGLVALERGLRWASSASTSSELCDPLAGLPKVAAWVAGLQRGLRERHCPGVDPVDLRFSPELTVAFSTRALAGAARRPGVRFVGPSRHPAPPGPPFPWHRLRPGRPVVLVTLGTANTAAAPRFLRAAAAALDTLADTVQAVLVDPGGAVDPARYPRLVVLQRIPQPTVLARCAAVVCHGGHNTVCEALELGVPLVVAPIRDDQPVLADQVTAACAGVRLRFDRVEAEDIAAAVTMLLTDPGYRAGARRIAASFAAAGGAEAAADTLTAWAAAPSAAAPSAAAETARRG